MIVISNAFVFSTCLLVVVSRYGQSVKYKTMVSQLDWHLAYQILYYVVLYSDIVYIVSVYIRSEHFSINSLVQFN